MKTKALFLGLLILILRIAISHAEVGVVARNASTPSRIIVQGTPSGPDPELQTWRILINVDPASVLNPGGDANGDGVPSFGFGEGAAQPPPTFVWARKVAAGNHDPVYAQFVNGAWTSPIVISSHPGDDLDPQWHQDAGGGIHAAWWRSGSGGAGGEVLYASREQGTGSFSAEELVSAPGEAARGAALSLTPDGGVLIGYETDPVNGARQVVVASKAGPMSAFQQEIVAATSYAGPTRPELKRSGNHVWITWIDSANRVDYAELVEGVWSMPQHEPCAGPDDVDGARLRIQIEITNE